MVWCMKRKDVYLVARFERYKNRKDGKQYWLLQCYLGTDEMTGKRVRVTRRKGEDGKPFKTKKQARDEVERLMLAFEEGKFNTFKHKSAQNFESFSDIANDWLMQRYKPTVADSTYLATNDMFFKLHILPLVGQYKLDKIDKRIMDAVVDEWQDSLSPHRFKLVVNYTSKVFDYAVELELMTLNPLTKVHIPKKKKSTPKRTTQFYDKQELNDFLTACRDYGDSDGFWYVFFHFLAYTGLRKGEALSLTWDDLNFEEGYVDVNKTTATRMGENGVRELTVHKMTKNGEHRTVTIDQYTTSLLKKHKLSQPARTTLVFPASKDNTRHMHGQTANKAMRTIIRKNDLKEINAHELRHTHCSLLFEAGVSMKEVQHRLGHKDISVTMNIYAHVTQSRSNEVAELFAEHVSQTEKKRKKTQKNAHSRAN